MTVRGTIRDTLGNYRAVGGGNGNGNGNGNGEEATFESLVAASNPVIWYDFQDANFNAGTSLQDRSGNAHHIPRQGATDIPVGSAFRSTTSQSADLATNSANSHYWRDTGGNINNSYVDLVTAITLTAAWRHDDLSQVYAKICGSRWATASTGICFLHSYGSPFTTEWCQIQGSNATIKTFAVATADINVHIWTMRVLNGVGQFYKDGVAVGGTQDLGVTTLYSAASEFEVAGALQQGGAGDFHIDHVHMNDIAMDDADIIAMHEAYIAELLT